MLGCNCHVYTLKRRHPYNPNGHRLSASLSFFLLLIVVLTEENDIQLLLHMDRLCHSSFFKDERIKEAGVDSFRMSIRDAV